MAVRLQVIITSATQMPPVTVPKLLPKDLITLAVFVEV